MLSGDQNAILDYRYCPSEKLTWYFDHHRTAFSSDADRADFERRAGTGRMFFDAKYTSCTKLVADIGRQNFGFEIRRSTSWSRGPIDKATTTIRATSPPGVERWRWASSTT